MRYLIPLQPIASQTLSCSLSGASCQIWLRQLSTGLYIDLSIEAAPILSGILCTTGDDLIRSPITPLPGKLFFTDTQGSNAPDYTGLGQRFSLIYEAPSL